MIPDRTEAAEYYFNYISQVGEGDICDVLAAQQAEALELFRGISEQDSRHRYAPDKWSIRQVLGHVNDGERLFVFRAMWFARNLPTPLPSFDQDIAVAAAGSDERPWRTHVAEFEALRAATVPLFANLPAEAWARRGIASDQPVTVRALAYITAGHLAHHLRILRERYLKK